MIYGYARVSTEAQDLTGATAQLKAAGCQKIYREKITGTTDLLNIARDMQRAGAGIRSLAEPFLDTTSDFAEIVFAILGRCREAGASPHHGTHGARPRRREGEGCEIRA